MGLFTKQLSRCRNKLEHYTLIQFITPVSNYFSSHILRSIPNGEHDLQTSNYLTNRNLHYLFVHSVYTMEPTKLKLGTQLIINSRRIGSWLNWLYQHLIIGKGRPPHILVEQANCVSCLYLLNALNFPGSALVFRRNRCHSPPFTSIDTDIDAIGR